MSQHIVSAFDAELKCLSKMIEDMGAHAQRLLDDALFALTKGDAELAQRVVEADQAIDVLQHDADELAVTTIAKRQPIASDLREVVATIRLSNDLERVGDLAKNIAKRAIAIKSAGTGYPQFASSFDGLARSVREQLARILASYRTRNDQTAVEVWRSDSVIDNLHSALVRELLTYMMEDPRNIGACTHLLFCAKNLERIGDHATNMAETIHYLISGETFSMERPKGASASSVPAPEKGSG